MINVIKPFPFYKQPDSKDCGPACLRMITKYYGHSYSFQTLRELCEINIEGVSLLGIKAAAEKLGFRTVATEIEFETFIEKAPLPCIVHWAHNHFVIVYKISKTKIYVADPANATVSYSKKEYLEYWGKSTKENKTYGIVLLLEPTSLFFENQSEKANDLGFSLILNYVSRYKKLLFQLIFSVLSIVVFQLIFPFLTKSIIDTGIAQSSTSYISLILAAQLALFTGRTSVDLIRSWIVLFIGSRINISLVSDFFWKVLRLPLSYFGSKVTGDLIQRVNDYKRIEQLFTTSAINILFSSLSLVTFSIFLAYYSTTILTVFLIFSLFYVMWVLVFLKKRQKIDYQKFETGAKNYDHIIQMLDGVQEIKLNNWEKIKISAWERIQSRLYEINIKSLSLEQSQQIGASFINELKNILIVFISAKLVIEKQITLGTMLAVQYVIGQLNGPLEQFVQFVRTYQDASLSINRLNEVFVQKEEEQTSNSVTDLVNTGEGIIINNLSFTYPGAGNQPILRNINIVIPRNKVTAIVGTSGSGKTTLIKLLLKFYELNSGSIKVEGTDLSLLKSSFWRNHCGAVMQDGFIFSDTIANNIASEENNIDTEKLIFSCKVANIYDFITSLPLGFNTVVGASGIGMSQGQKQRILIARAVYKNPSYIFLDEATNALDANNERRIVENLQSYFLERTVVVIAHRLSTVRNADQIIVLEKGEVIEVGSHSTLIDNKGTYFQLVKNQLELSGEEY